MKSKSIRSFVLLVIVLLVLLSLSKNFADNCCGRTIAFFASFWEKVHQGKNSFQTFVGKDAHKEEEIRRLQLDNRMLLQEIYEMQGLLEHELSLKEELIALKAAEPLPSSIKKSVQTHLRDKAKLLQLQFEAVPARVIFRSPALWESSLWINVGEVENQALGRKVISKNSPVTVGDSIVGVVEYVGKQQSRVRLITDSALTPSVRVKRVLGKETTYLAKGELQGSGNPLWRSRGSHLKGIGFNYEFADEEGPSRDLRNDTIIKVNDLLVTTGMDGIFPAGFQVALVTKIKPLDEGDYFYEIEASPTAGDLDSLHLVFVLPPLSNESRDENSEASF